MKEKYEEKPEREIHLPMNREAVSGLLAGDIIYLSGTIFTARDKAHARAIQYAKKNRSLPVNLAGGVIFHSGPLVRDLGGGWEMVAIGPTTSSRMNSVEPELIRRFGIRAIIGKGGMDETVVNAMKQEKAVYLSMTGGCAASAAGSVKAISEVHWLDLGLPEAIWVLEVERFGPLIVSIDSNGTNLYRDVSETVRSNLNGILNTL